MEKKQQEERKEHSYIRKPHKVEWTKQHETRESFNYTSPLSPIRNGDYDHTGNWKRHRSTPLSVEQRRHAVIGYDHKRNNSSDNRWNNHDQAFSDKMIDTNFGKKNHKMNYQRTEPISPIVNAYVNPIINSNAKPILNAYANYVVSAEPMPMSNVNANANLIINDEYMVNVNANTNPIVDAKIKHQDAQYLQTDPILPDSKKNVDQNEDTSIKSEDDQDSQILPGTCPTCESPIDEVGYYIHWCSTCQAKIFEMKFGSWSSGNDDIDMFILETQLSSPSRFDYLEWIPFAKFKEVRFIGSGGYGNVYQAIWLDGPREKWDAKTARYVRRNKQHVVLRSFNNLGIGPKFFDEFSKFLTSENNSGAYVCRYYGITQDPFTNNYMIVGQYARDGDLRKYCKQNPESITWKKKLDILYGVAIEFDYEIPECYSNLIERCLDLDQLNRPTAEELYWTLGEWLCMVNIPGSDIAEQFNEADKSLPNSSPFSDETNPEAVYTSSRYNFESLEMPTIIFTKTNNRSERLAVRQYMANETKLCNTKYQMICAENSDIAAEVYEILAYW
ncbi:4197_t:CDS:2 [Dentiscutata erythropus]|uniref:4197_t:CDS:1 n=1 Tax=Dentiscutata erythropus TaxID=1348616 RepID=A0A9N9HH08_9GLOM|nr:4197_t:CDS:2 [Dentiscutata erythropus]